MAPAKPRAMEEPLFPRNPWKDPVALRQRMERAAASVRQDEATGEAIAGTF